MTRLASSLNAVPWREGAPFSLLIADGDALFRELVRRSLGRRVVVVGDAGDGEEVVLMARRLHPDVVLMDIAMPTIDGPEAARQIKADRAETKVILLTSGREPRELLHADALLRKEVVRVGMMAETRRTGKGGRSPRRRRGAGREEPRYHK
jgi:CheY-like chemotaxis protein